MGIKRRTTWEALIVAAIISSIVGFIVGSALGLLLHSILMACIFGGWTFLCSLDICLKGR